MTYQMENTFARFRVLDALFDPDAQFRRLLPEQFKKKMKIDVGHFLWGKKWGRKVGVSAW